MMLLLPKKLLKFWCNKLYDPYLYICLVFLFYFIENFLVGKENKLYKINLLPDK